MTTAVNLRWPRPLRMLSTPRRVWHEAKETQTGLGAFAVSLFVAFCLSQPHAVVGRAWYVSNDPAIALAGLWADYQNFVSVPLFGALFSGVILYYLVRWRAAPRLDLSAAIAIMAYNFTPLLFVSAARVLFPWGAQILSWVEYAPCLWLVYSAIRHFAWHPNDAADEPQRPVSLWLGSGILLSALVVAGWQVKTNYRDLRPMDVGDALPQLNLAGLDRPDVNTRDLRGCVVLLDFWASWCGPCAQSMPFLQTLHDSLHEAGLRILAVNTEGPNIEAVRAFRDARHLSIPMYVDESALQSRFHIISLPTSILIDKAGVIRHVYRGIAQQKELAVAIKQLLKEAA